MVPHTESTDGQCSSTWAMVKDSKRKEPSKGQHSELTHSEAVHDSQLLKIL